LQESILRTVRRVGFLSLGLLFGAAALALLLGALYAFLSSLLSAPAALALMGLASAVVALFLLWGARGTAAPGPQAEDEGEAGRKTAAAAATPESGPAPKPVASAPPPGEAPDIWAGVPPYGHGGHKGAPTGKGKEPAPTEPGA
ncbi:MAG: hypothetical protein K2G99_04195, partial [Desulfovibrio sp.]|nr:hypothetical protein [Desulfovibrio sp.]